MRHEKAPSRSKGEPGLTSGLPHKSERAIFVLQHNSAKLLVQPKTLEILSRYPSTLLSQFTASYFQHSCQAASHQRAMSKRNLISDGDESPLTVAGKERRTEPAQPKSLNPDYTIGSDKDPNHERPRPKWEGWSWSVALIACCCEWAPGHYAGADIHTKDVDGETALSWAVESGTCVIVDLLLKNGADVDKRNYRGWTPLHLAIEDEEDAMIKSLNQSVSHYEQLEYRLADFNLWIDGIGALAPSKASLDSRLNERQIDLSLVKGNLVMLLQSLQDCLNLLKSQETLKESLLDIDSALESLVSLSLAIRKTGRRSRLHKADRLLSPEDHNELRRHLEAIILLRPGAGPCLKESIRDVELPVPEIVEKDSAPAITSKSKLVTSAVPLTPRIPQKSNQAFAAARSVTSASIPENHVLEHIHDFSLRSLPWPISSDVDLGGEVGSFNPECEAAVTVTEWIKGYKHETFADEHGDESAEAETDVSQLTYTNLDSLNEVSQLGEADGGHSEGNRNESDKKETTGRQSSTDLGKLTSRIFSRNKTKYLGTLDDPKAAGILIHLPELSQQAFNVLSKLYQRRGEEVVATDGPILDLASFLQVMVDSHLHPLKSLPQRISPKEYLNAIREALQTGYRSIDIEVWDGVDDDTEEVQGMDSNVLYEPSDPSSRSARALHPAQSPGTIECHESSSNKNRETLDIPVQRPNLSAEDSRRYKGADQRLFAVDYYGNVFKWSEICISRQRHAVMDKDSGAFGYIMAVGIDDRFSSKLCIIKSVLWRRLAGLGESTPGSV
ncbi:hypothetical protein FGRMN_9925 [Fusarium graminum]|nr:hypothetical protein FGRMN_9925 [Fusarium graminum]